MSLLQPAPNSPAKNCVHMTSADAKHLSDDVLRMYAFEISHLPDLVCSDLGGAMALTPSRRTVREHVLAILSVRRPIQMLRIGTSLMTTAAIMRGLMLWCRRLAVRQFAHVAGSQVLAIDIDVAVAVGVSAERPRKTLLPLMISVIVQPLLWRSRFGWRFPAAQWIAMPPEAAKMSFTKAVTETHLAAVVDHAYVFGNHSILLRSGWSEAGMALVTPVGFAILEATS